MRLAQELQMIDYDDPDYTTDLAEVQLTDEQIRHDEALLDELAAWYMRPVRA
jgi:hypothetical protein